MRSTITFKINLLKMEISLCLSLYWKLISFSSDYKFFFYQSFWFNVRRQKKTHTTLQIYVVVDLWIWLENTFRFYMEIPFQLLPLLIALYTHGCRTTWVLHTAGSEGKQLSGVAGSEDAKRALHRRDGSSAATLLFKAIVQWKINK